MPEALFQALDNTIINSARESSDMDVARRRLLTGRRINLRFPSYVTSDVYLNYEHYLSAETSARAYSYIV